MKTKFLTEYNIFDWSCKRYDKNNLADILLSNSCRYKELFILENYRLKQNKMTFLMHLNLKASAEPDDL